jgi:hypothetical protein
MMRYFKKQLPLQFSQNKFDSFALRRNTILIIFLVFLISSEIFAQFDSLMFRKEHQYPCDISNMIHGLGDQNGDGYDDFLLWDCNTEQSYIFFGGSPVDTVADDSIPSMRPPQAIIDLNDDGIKDLVFYDFNIIKAQVYYGGEEFSVLPDLSFSPPPGAKTLIGGKVIKDFDGDGRSELLLFDPHLPYSNKQFGSFYFYNTESEFDTIPEYALFGDSSTFLTIALS